MIAFTVVMLGFGNSSRDLISDGIERKFSSFKSEGNLKERNKKIFGNPLGKCFSAGSKNDASPCSFQQEFIKFSSNKIFSIKKTEIECVRFVDGFKPINKFTI